MRRDGFRLGVFCLVSAVHWGALAGAPVIQQPVTAESGTTVTGESLRAKYGLSST